MLTFFRRIRKGLLREGSTRKYLLYAIGEIALVVIGILIALQINNWNEWRKDRVVEREIYVNLHREFQFNKIHLQETQRIVHKSQNAGYKILDLIGRDKKMLSELNLDSLIFYSIEYAPFSPSQNVLSDLLQSGRLQLINDGSLKDLLYEWSKSVLRMEESFAGADDWVQDYLLPYLSDHVSLINIDLYQPQTKLQNSSRLNHDKLFIFGDLKYENYQENLRYAFHRYLIRLSEMEKIIDNILQKTDLEQ